MLAKILTAKQYRILQLQEGSRWRAPLSREEAELIAESEKFAHTHVAVCDGVRPIYATIGDGTMVVRFFGGIDDGLEESVDIKNERDAINKLIDFANDIFTGALAQL